MVRRYGTPTRFWIGPKLFILVDQPDDVQIVLNSPNSSYKGEVYAFLEFFKKGSGGLITINGEKWKTHRKLLNPCFIPKILDSYLPIFNACSKIMVEKISKVADHKIFFDIEENIHCCSLDMICGECLLVDLVFCISSRSNEFFFILRNHNGNIPGHSK
jgi:cytochrome P450 family 4